MFVHKVEKLIESRLPVFRGCSHASPLPRAVFTKHDTLNSSHRPFSRLAALVVKLSGYCWGLSFLCGRCFSNRHWLERIKSLDKSHPKKKYHKVSVQGFLMRLPKYRSAPSIVSLEARVPDFLAIIRTMLSEMGYVIPTASFWWLGGQSYNSSSSWSPLLNVGLSSRIPRQTESYI